MLEISMLDHFNSEQIAEHPAGTQTLWPPKFAKRIDSTNRSAVDWPGRGDVTCFNRQAARREELANEPTPTANVIKQRLPDEPDIERLLRKVPGKTMASPQVGLRDNPLHAAL